MHQDLESWNRTMNYNTVLRVIYPGQELFRVISISIEISDRGCSRTDQVVKLLAHMLGNVLDFGVVSFGRHYISYTGGKSGQELGNGIWLLSHSRLMSIQR